MSPDHLSAEFEAVFGYPADGCFRAPGRVNLIGEHTDYNDGLVLPIAIDRAVHVAIGRRRDSTGRRRDSIGRRGGSIGSHTDCVDGPGIAAAAESADTVRLVSNHRDEQGHRLEGRFAIEGLVPRTIAGWLSHPAGVIFEVARTTGATMFGVDLFIDSTVPVGAGLSSSHALEVAVLIALDAVFGLNLGDREKVFLTQRAENDFVGAPTGIVDQAASVMARAEHALFLDCHDLSTRQIPFDLPSQGLSLMVIDTRVSHSHAETGDSSTGDTDADSSTDSSGYAARRRSCEDAARALQIGSLREITDTTDLGILTEEQTKRVRHVLSENSRVRASIEALDRGDIRAIGEHLLASHESLARDYEVSCPELDRAVAAAMDAGAIGARMTGGGFGGSAIALVEAQHFETVSAAVGAAFAESGYRTPHVFAVTAGEGAGRLDG